MAAPDEVKRLVERFHGDRERLKRVQFGETEARVQFINPLFEALGWDVTNAMNLREVVHEDAVRVGMAHKAPDYGFYAAQERKFFVEAKKPSVNLLTNPEPAFQLRRYAWSARLPVSVLTDFEEFAIYDTRVQPDQADRASVARLSHITYESYADRWDEIAGLFSKAAVYDGVLEKWVESQRRPKGATVDRAFLAEIERWRALLATAIAAGNPELSGRELNYAVQMTVDRILFLRMAEDRGIEEYGRLLALTNGGDVYQRLRDLYRQADERYNSGLFHFREERDRAEGYDALTPGLTIDDTALKDIFKNLYYPHSPYEFSVLPVDVLGQVYEQFLGKVIALDSHGRVEIEEKPEVRKAGGVYYTPTYIVDYIVEHTVGKLLEGKTPRQAEKLRILDPACGSGSFLLGAYEYLLNWHCDWYVTDGPEKHRKVLYQGLAGEWRLTTEERKKILRNNLYGVDIDAQAVEVTKLSLILKLLEGETSGTLDRARQLSFVRERVLPDLGDNIKCGNSLIGPDFYDNPQMTFLPAEDQYRINVFDWDAEFSSIMKADGFDVVIGNPPWGAAFDSIDLEYLRGTYRRVINRMVDSYIYFIDKLMRVTNEDAVIGLVIPSTVLNQVDTGAVRRLLLDRGLSVVVSMGKDIFTTKVLNTTTLLVSERRNPGSTVIVSDLSNLPLSERGVALPSISPSGWAEWHQAVSSDPTNTFFVGDASASALLDRLRKIHPSLESVLGRKIQRGVSPDIAAAHVVARTDLESSAIEAEVMRSSVSGSQIKRYNEWKSDQVILYTSRSTPIDRYPNAFEHLRQFRHLNTCKEVVEGKHPWWSLH